VQIKIYIMLYPTNLTFCPTLYEHGTMIFYNQAVSLSQTSSMTNLGIRLITELFNNITKYVFNIMQLYKPTQMKTPYLIYIYKTI